MDPDVTVIEFKTPLDAPLEDLPPSAVRIEAKRP